MYDISYKNIETNSIVIYFFFFQAEDGIRDLTVTGVQTCALPICCPGASSKRSARGPWRSRRARSRAQMLNRSMGCSSSTVAGRAMALETCTRSEEHTSELQSQSNLVCRLLLEKKKKDNKQHAVLRR